MSVRVNVDNRLQLEKISKRLSNPYPILSQWRGIRFRLVKQMFDQEVDPQGKPLRDLTEDYQKWKSRNYPGRRKRELSKDTRLSHRVKISKDSLLEVMEDKAVLLQDYLDLPVFPDEWDDQTYREFEQAAIRYLNI